MVYRLPGIRSPGLPYSATEGALLFSTDEKTFKQYSASGVIATLSGAGAWAFGLPDEVIRSLAPKSITAPVAMGVAEKIGGVPALAAVFAVLTGLVGIRPRAGTA